MRLGIIVNPIAGMGGSVGLKGTDGDALTIARKMGAVPNSADKASRALSRVDLSSVDVVSPPDGMGSEILTSMGVRHEILPLELGGSGQDTIEAVTAMGDVDLLIFCGGDGTARDILDAAPGLTVLGIPAGVKMHSGVFAATPEAAGDMLKAFLEGSTDLDMAEVMDIDEDAFRSGILKVELHGYMRSLTDAALMPGSKGPSDVSDQDQREDIGESVVTSMRPGVLYLIGPGTTAKACMDVLGLEHSILGVDAVRDRRLVASDISSEEIIRILEASEETCIVLGVIGGQGFILGRGNQQFTPDILRRVGVDNMIVLCTPSKLSRLKALRVDSGDPNLDDELRGMRRAVIGYGRERIVKVV